MLNQQKQFLSAIAQISQERGVPEKRIIKTIESAIAAAYRKDYGKPSQKIEAKFNKKTGDIEVFQIKKVITKKDLKTESGKTREINEDREILLKDAKKKKKNIKSGDKIKIKLPSKQNYGRIAAQTAKQVIIQKVREEEKNFIYQEFKENEGNITSGIVQRIEGKNVYIDLGRTTGILPASEQVHGEHYIIGQRIKVLIIEVNEGAKDSPGIILSRSRPEMLSKLFAVEVPEVGAKTVIIKSVAREPGSRSKVAVYSKEEGIDPIGALIGQKGVRIQTVINEIGGEMIDVIKWTKKTKEFISQSLSPAKVTSVKINKKEKKATVYVPEEQLSLAIGKRGQNVRLAAILTGWKIDVTKESDEK